ncbi:Uncharacterised protein [Salmonella bongori]|nr:Uncharacterised protein [Salmonella bongori]
MASPLAFSICSRVKIDISLRRHQFQIIPNGEFIFYRHSGQLPFTLTSELADKLLAFGDGVPIFIILVIVVRMATKETFGIAAMGQTFQRFQQSRVKGFTRRGVVYRFTVNLRGTGAVIKRIWCALRFLASGHPFSSGVQRGR